MATNTRKAVVLVADGDIEVHDFPKRSEQLEWMQTIVGGYIELVKFKRERFDICATTFDMYLNEDGHSLGLPRNEVATTLLRDSGILLPGQWVVGNAIIISGRRDGEGNAFGLSKNEYSLLDKDLASIEHAKKIATKGVA